MSQIAQNMAREATRLIKRRFPDIPIDIKAVQETPDKAVGNGTGIWWISLSCFLIMAFYIFDTWILVLIFCSIIIVVCSIMADSTTGYKMAGSAIGKRGTINDFPFSLPPFLPSSLPPFLPSSLPPFLPSSLPSFLPSSLHSFQPSNIHLHIIAFISSNHFQYSFWSLQPFIQQLCSNNCL